VFVDASAIVAILTEEGDGRSLAETLDAARAPLTSPIAVWEAAASISRKTRRSAESELPDILAFLEAADVVIVPIDMAVTSGALTAFDRYGRRSGHPADLNIGDCFAYAVAKRNKTELLYKGKEFGLTDLRRD
jgi:ribonuclease VapC